MAPKAQYGHRRRQQGSAGRGEIPRQSKHFKFVNAIGNQQPSLKKTGKINPGEDPRPQGRIP